MATFYWHDFETFGTDPRRDRPSQFAGLRTDEQFNIVGEPLVLYCQPPADYLPHPEACLITGITPQTAAHKGLPEAEFIQQIHQAFMQPETCVVGYNNIRFDDEVTRNTLYRNFYDPYEREYKNGNSRWDLIDVVRATYALRPEGIEWPSHPDGKPSFRLEQLTQANNLTHESAHDALSDVKATIEMARLIKTRQPRLFDYMFRLRQKREVRALLDTISMKPVVHVSSKFPSERGCVSWVAPVVDHPVNQNAVIVCDLTVDPTPLLELDLDTLRHYLFTPRRELEADAPPIGVKAVHTNKCPIIAPAKTLTAERAEALNIDRLACRRHLDLLKKYPQIRQKISQLFEPNDSLPVATDPDEMLYSGGFFSHHDKSQMALIRDASVDDLSTLKLRFEDPRLSEMLFRYRARNWPQSLSEEEQARWRSHCQHRLMDPNGGASIDLQSYLLKLESLAEEKAGDDISMRILKALYDYVQ